MGQHGYQLHVTPRPEGKLNLLICVDLCILSCVCLISFHQSVGPT